MSRISVALPVRNASATLSATLESLVWQTLRDFDVVLLDDASQDNSVEIADSYRNRLRIHIITAESNMGISGARNRLIDEIDADYVAVLDHDDICHPDRLLRQRDFLDSHTEIDIVGSDVAFFEQLNDLPHGLKIMRHPNGDAAIRTALLFNTALVHPSAMARRNFFVDCGGYQAEFSPAEDYALWIRAALQGKRFANIDRPLLYYRRHANQASRVQSQRMVVNDIEIKRKYIRELLSAEDDGSLAELFCPYLRQSDKSTLAAAMTQMVPKLFKLGQRVACPETYHQMVSRVFADNILSLE
jgi:glycosyltransferase involved in cell wall biosynthesis